MVRRLALVLLLALTLPACASDAAAKLRLVKVGTFDHPVYVTASAGDARRVYVVQQNGVVRVVRDGKASSRPFLDLRPRVRFEGEQGLLSIAFDPSFATNRLLYAFFTTRDGHQHVEEFFARSPDFASADTARLVLDLDDPAPNNNGGQLQFGPDGLLYVSSGDGGGEERGRPDPFNTAQDLGSPFGKLLRIDPHGDTPGAYSSPADNPFRAAGQRPEIYAYGLRNPWRFSFDAKTGALIIGDVGRGAQEEVDFFARGAGRGANLGWPRAEGIAGDNTGVKPAMTFDHEAPPAGDNFCAITGGYVSRDPRVLPGRYLFADLCAGEIRAARLPAGTSRTTGLTVSGGLVSFGQDARRRLYAVGLEGTVYRIAG